MFFSVRSSEVKEQRLCSSEGSAVLGIETLNQSAGGRLFGMSAPLYSFSCNLGAVFTGDIAKYVILVLIHILVLPRAGVTRFYVTCILNFHFY